MADDEKPETISQQLDRISGPPAGLFDLNPDEFRQIATTLQRLALQADAIRDAGLARDERLGRLSHDLAVVRTELEKVHTEVEVIAGAQFTDSDRTTMKAIILSHERRAWAWQAVLRYAGYVSGTLAAVWLLREPLAAFLGAISKGLSR